MAGSGDAQLKELEKYSVCDVNQYHPHLRTKLS